MFMYKKKVFIILVTIFVIFSFFAEASKPNAPGPYIGVTDINKSAVRINFLDNSDNEDGFLLYGNGFNISVPKNNENTHKYVYANITNLVCNKVYSLKVLAYNLDGNSTPSDLRSFNIHTTFDIPCPSVKLSSDLKKGVILKTSKGKTAIDMGAYDESGLSTIVQDFDNPIVSCKYMIDGRIFFNLCENINIGFRVNDFLFISPDDVLKNKKHEISVLVTDSQGVSATDSIPAIFIDDGSDSIYVNPAKTTLKVGETILIDAGISSINPRGGCGTTVTGHSWVDSNHLGTFDDSMFETGHFICYGYRASTSYTAKKAGNTVLKLFANGGRKDININIVEDNYTRNIVKKVTIDNLTGLMWQDNDTIKKPWTDGGTYRDFFTSGDTATNYCKNLNWGGYSDWRIPNINELSSYIFINDEEHWASSKGSMFANKISAITSKFDMRHDYNPNLLVKCVRNIN